jgi:hypothetical protein
MISVLTTNPTEVMTPSFHEWGIYLEFYSVDGFAVGLLVLGD